MADTGTVSDPDLRGRLGAGLRDLARTPVRGRTYLNLVYLLLSFPLGLAYFVFVIVGVSLGLGLTVVFLSGLVLLAATLAVSLGLARVEGWLATTMLDVEVSFDPELSGERTREKAKSLLTRRQTWTALLYLPTKFFLGVASFVLVLTSLSTAVSLLLVPFYYDRPGLYVGLVPDRAPEIHSSIHIGWNYLLVGFDTVVTVGSWQIDSLPAAIVAALFGILLLFVALYGLNLLARAWAWYTRLMLDGTYDLPGALVGRL